MSVATVPGMRMAQRSSAEKALFLMHYKRTLTPLAIVYFGLFILVAAVMFTAKYFTSDADLTAAKIGQVLDITMMIWGIPLALPVGTAVFSRAFKEQQILFFHSLPVSRARQWVMLTASSAAALITIYAIAAILRPGAVKMLAAEPLAALVLTAAILILFAAGACYSLVFARPIAVYVSAFLMLVGFLTAGGALVVRPFKLYVGVKTLSARYLADNFKDHFPVSAVAVFVIAFIVMFLVCSLLFYLRGELVTFRTQLRNFGVVLAAGAFIVLVVTPAAIAIAVRRDPMVSWSYDVGRSGNTAVASFRGREYPWRAAIKILDLDSGRSVMVDTPGLLERFALDHGVVASIRDIGLLPGKRSDRAVVYDTSGKVLRETRFEGEEIIDLAVRDDQSIVAVTDDGAKSHVYLMKADAPPRELASAAVDQPPSAWVRPNIVLIPNRIEQNRGWIIGDGEATEVSWAKANAQEIMPNVVRGIAYPSRESILAQIERDEPLPRTAGDAVAYAIPSVWQSGGPVEFIFAIRAKVAQHIASVYVLPPNEKTWRLISASVPLVQNDTFADRPTFTDYRLAWVARADRYDRLMYVDTAGGKTVLKVYDARAGRSIDVLPLSGLDPRLSIGTGASRNGITTFSIVRRTDDVSLTISLGRYIYDGDHLTTLPDKTGPFIARRADGTLLFASNDAVTLMSPTGTKRVISFEQK